MAYIAIYMDQEARGPLNKSIFVILSEVDRYKDVTY